jgi:hypothetical protein
MVLEGARDSAAFHLAPAALSKDSETTLTRFKRKSMFSKTSVSYTPSRLKSALGALKKRTDSEKGPFFGRFGRIKRVGRQRKSILFFIFARFSGFLRLQVVVRQYLPENFRLQNKSCRKAYGRLFNFGEL